MNWPELAKAAFLALLGSGGAGLVYLVLTLRPQRRKIDAGASSDEANAASTLSGAALEMVREARAESRAARLETAECRGQITAERAISDQLRRDNADMHESLTELRRHVDRLVRLIQAAGIELPAELDPRQGGSL